MNKLHSNTERFLVFIKRGVLIAVILGALSPAAFSIAESKNNCFVEWPYCNEYSCRASVRPSFYLIDQNDTLKFNIPEGFLNGNIIDIPVSVSSDDTVYSVDFAIKYNFLNVEFDSIINLTSGLQYLYHLNPFDSVLRFTSNRLVPIPNDSSLILIRFKTFTGQICAFDFDSLVAYLNGDICTAVATGCLVTSVNNVMNYNRRGIFYPNPASDEITFHEDIESGEVVIMNPQGRVLFRREVSGNDIISLSMLPKGLYLVMLNNHPLHKLILQ